MAEIDAPEATAESPQEPGGRRISLLALVLLIAVVGLAAYIGANVLGVLFAVISPPMPPMPLNLTETRHENVAYGVDHWRYTSTENACTLVKYLEENGGECEYAPMQCIEPPEQSTSVAMATEGIVGRCGGRIDFSIFTMTWFGLVIRESETEVQLQLDREVYWMGTGPQP
ncbi:MAG: hypothetical protein ABI835_05435 [Chloroflexota bacterium]